MRSMELMLKLCQEQRRLNQILNQIKSNCICFLPKLGKMSLWYTIPEYTVPPRTGRSTHSSAHCRAKPGLPLTAEQYARTENQDPSSHPAVRLFDTAFTLGGVVSNALTTSKDRTWPTSTVRKHQTRAGWSHQEAGLGAALW